MCMRLSNFISVEMFYMCANPLKEHNSSKVETKVLGIFLMNVAPSPLFTR